MNCEVVESGVCLPHTAPNIWFRKVHITNGWKMEKSYSFLNLVGQLLRNNVTSCSFKNSKTIY